MVAKIRLISAPLRPKIALIYTGDPEKPYYYLITPY